MARTAKALSKAQIRKLPPGRHAVGGVAGLHIEIGRTGGRRWKLRRYVDGRQRVFDLGDEATMSLEQAREAASAPLAKPSRRPAAKRAPAEAVSDNPFLGPGARELLAMTAAQDAAEAL